MPLSAGREGRRGHSVSNCTDPFNNRNAAGFGITPAYGRGTVRLFTAPATLHQLQLPRDAVSRDTVRNDQIIDPDLEGLSMSPDHIGPVSKPQ